MKKINEGIIEFETLMSKARTVNTTNQKDKLEADLKRDIKKLQRMRETIKGWISGTEVKDKAPLQDARKRIEVVCDRFLFLKHTLLLFVVFRL
jgi:CCR4-NOT transcription complex subunit 3